MFYPPSIKLSHMDHYNIKKQDRLMKREAFLIQEKSRTILPSFKELVTSIPITGNEKPSKNIDPLPQIPVKPYIHKPFAQRPMSTPVSLPSTPDRLSPYPYSITQGPMIPITTTGSLDEVPTIKPSLTPILVDGNTGISPLPSSPNTADQAVASPRTNTRKHVCKTCSKSFTTSGHLARHNRIHTGERKHVCPWASCGARFARQDNCMQHYKIHLHGKSRRNKNIKL